MTTTRPPWRQDTGAWKRLSAQVYAEEAICYLCGHPVDTRPNILPHNDPWSRSVDHIIPPAWCLYLFGDDRGLDRSNVRLAHRDCNNRKGSGPPPTVLMPPPGAGPKPENNWTTRRRRNQAKDAPPTCPHCIEELLVKNPHPNGGWICWLCGYER